MSQRRHVSAAVFAVVLLASGAQRASSAEPAVDLSGTWVLNAEASDDPQEEFRRWVQARGVGGGARAGDRRPAATAAAATTSRAAAGAGAWPASAAACSR